MAVLFFNSDVLLSVAEVQKRVKDLQEWQVQIAVLQKQVAETEEWLNLVAKVIGPARAKQLIGDAPLITQVEAPNEKTPPTIRQRPEGVTWTSFIEDYVNSANRPVNYAELRQAISNSILGSKRETSKKTFYGAILKLTDSRRVVKEDGWIFSFAAFDEYKCKVANGEIEPLPPRSSKQHARRPRVGDEIRRRLKTRTNGKTGISYRSPQAPPNDKRGSEEETAVSSESSEAYLIPPAGHDAEPTNMEVGKDQRASGIGPLTSTIYVGIGSAAALPEIPQTNSLNPDPPGEVLPTTQTPPIDFGGRELPPPTKSLFPADPSVVPPGVPPTTSQSPAGPAAAPPEPSPAVKSLFDSLSAAPPEVPLVKSPPAKAPLQAEPAAAPSDVQTQPMDLARED
ncbi:MAG: hypothetical protein E5V75_05100 [Mesorhizobium sp.]|nr:MAG: hypothetical protein E5V75_05100 [Mesorhizobium sp.]